jgi:hypothetical protein
MATENKNKNIILALTGLAFGTVDTAGTLLPAADGVASRNVPKDAKHF